MSVPPVRSGGFQPPGEDVRGESAAGSRRYETSSALRWLWPAIIVVALVWAIALGTLAATRANPPTLNRVQFARADALALVEVRQYSRSGMRGEIKEAVPGGRGPVPAELETGSPVVILGFAEDLAETGTLAAAPVRRVGDGWEIAEAPEGLPRLVYPVANPGDWSDLKAAAAALSAGRDPYR
ncbi:hypothetical protein [Alienimonas chondri]|uniref:Uncharacterized protein n=1 Tax=Alienimonas chondri TaxID=2681879 RepID=A0ABX1VIW1_9PLAN|nr:hypothetical protein [Alienimonas chondri]NNJ27218.1 hypothetical protein [Alienimonas chondri]